jgi:predicted dehydrogenase
MINIGIIGNGMIAREHILSFKKVPGTNIKWIAGRDFEKLKKSQESYSIQNITTNYKEILDDNSVQAVVITTPPAMHEQMFLDALKAQKHILLEKPAAINPSSIEKMLKESAKYPELVICDCSCRHARLQPKFKYIKDIIDSGKLGEIYYIHHNSVAQHSRPGIEYHPTAKWFIDKKIAGGGPVIDWGVYDLSFHLGILSDKPELLNLKAFTKCGLDNVDPGSKIFNVEEHAVIFMEFTGGLKYYWERASHANMNVPNETRIYGTKGGLKLSYCSWDSAEAEFFDVANEGKGKARKEVFSIDMSNHTSDSDELAIHFMDCINNRKTPAMPLKLAAKHLNILFKVYETCEV